MSMPVTDYINLLIQGLVNKQIPWNFLDDDQAKIIERWRAFRYGDRRYLQAIRPGWNPQRLYRVDRLPARAAVAFSDFMVSDSPVVTPGDEGDRQSMQDLVRANNLAGKLRGAADVQVSEREVWWRIYVNEGVSAHACLEFHSRTEVIPYMAGDVVLAAAFITSFYPSDPSVPIYRHLECHQDGFVRNYLFQANPIANTTEDRESGTWYEPQTTELGSQVDLEKHVMTARLREQWDHGLPILCGRIKNGDSPESIFALAEDHLLDLNEAHTIDAENFRLAGKKRARMSKKYADQAGNADAGEEIFFDEDDGDEMENDKSPFEILEYNYHADDAIKRKDDLERISLTRMGLARQLVDANANEGLAQTGTALRTRLLPTVASLKGALKEWTDKSPIIVGRLAQVDALPARLGGPGHEWKHPEKPPGVKLSDPLPADEAEEAQRHPTLIGAEIESIETAINELRPDWPVEQRQLEVKRILANRRGFALDDQGQIIEMPKLLLPTPNAPDRSRSGGGSNGSNGDGTQTEPPGGDRAPASQQG